MSNTGILMGGKIVAEGLRQSAAETVNEAGRRPRLMSPIQQQAHRMACEAREQDGEIKEAEIRKAISAAGIPETDLTAALIAENGFIRFHPDGSEEFIWQGELLVHFGPMQTEIVNGENGTTVQITRDITRYYEGPTNLQ